MKLKWLVVNQNHHIIQIKMVSGKPKLPNTIEEQKNPKPKLGSLQL
jgi:hypothetical protein